MNLPINHHYVPKVYLKEFADSQKQFYQLVKAYKKCTLKSISQVCYEPNYFKINPTNNLLLSRFKDKLHIEKNVFKRQENLYGELLKKITLSSLHLRLLKKTDVLFFLEILITIKRRNPNFKKAVIEDFKTYINSSEFRKMVEKGFEISRQIDNIDPELYFENYLKEMTTNKDKEQEIYLERFVDVEDKTAEYVAQQLINYKMAVCHAPIGSQFITSDNLGFTMLPDGQLISYGGFGLSFTFLFPLTPTCCLFISYTHQELNTIETTKTIYHTYADKNFVDKVNEGTYILANQKVFSYTEKPLTTFFKISKHL